MESRPITVHQVGIRERRVQLDIKAHVHHTDQWYACFHGGMTVSIDGRLHHLGPGASILVPPGAQRSIWRSGAPVTYLVLLFDDHALRLRRVYGRVLQFGDDLVADAHALAAELRAPSQADSALLSEVLVTRLLIGLRRDVLRREGRGRARGAREVRDSQALEVLVRRVESTMQAQLHRPLTRADLAASVHCSEPHLARLFRRATGKTLHQRLLELRLNLAATLLRESDLSVSEVAMEVGFSSFSHFAKRFREAYGVPPSAWRAVGGRSGE